MANKKITPPVYPVSPTSLAMPLGYALGSAVMNVLVAPYNNEGYDCRKALFLLDLERECPQAMIPAPYYFAWREHHRKMTAFLSTAKGDALWQDIASNALGFLESLKKYLCIPDAGFLHEMEKHIRELCRVLDLRDTTGQIYEGMTGLPDLSGDEEGE